MAREYRLRGGRKAFNVLMKALIQRGIPTGNTYLLTTIGRKSGQPRATPVSLVTQNGRRWLVSPYGEMGWVRNIRANGRATLKSSRGSETVRLREASADQAGPILKQYLESYAITASFFKARKGDPVARFIAEANLHPVFAIEPA